MATGKTTRLTATECLFTQSRTAMKATGSTIYKKDKAKSTGVMAVCTLAVFFKDKKKDMVKFKFKILYIRLLVEIHNLKIRWIYF